uniref:DEAH-box helicase 32 (putative) n=1 Tax=Anas platyrhynchos TaxID=8839 RepID=A0A8B9TT71_ANAPL
MLSSTSFHASACSRPLRPGVRPIVLGLALNPFDGLPYSSRYYKLMKERQELPVWKVKYTFMESLLHNQIVIVSGDAKTGKSSQIPQWCAEYCLSASYRHGVVVCTQVHKQTAVWLALRAADEMDVSLGHEVGYFVPFESCCSTETILRFVYCTDDMLQREMMSAPLLNSYGVIILDDVHERTVPTDVLLGILKDVLISRPELRLVILTAPHMSIKLQNYCGSVPFIREIEKAYQIIKQEQANLNPDLGELIPVPLYPTKRDLIPKPNQDKQKCYKKYRRKVLLTTSFGESLIWIKNVTFVIDVGVERRKVYNPRIRADSVITQPISKSQEEITISSKCKPIRKLFCLYPEEFTHKEMKPDLPAKIQESNLTSMVLFLKRMDIAGLGHCDFLSRPAPESLMQALEDLDYLAALDNDGNLSEFGIIMSEFPLDPQLSKSILASCEFDCVDEMLTDCSHAPNCFLHAPPGTEEIALTCWRKFSHPAGDHFTLINVFNAFREAAADSTNQCNCSALRMAEIIRAELVEIMKRIELPISEPDFGSQENVLNIKKALLSGYFMHVARDVDGSGNYLMLAHRQVAQLDPFSSYCNSRRIPEWVLFHEFSISEDNSIRVVSEISPDLFVKLTPQYYFSNLPPSESKDILQEAINHLSPVSAMKEEQKTNSDNTENEKYHQPPTEQRCIIQ